jgi:hypothetical protein
MLYNNGRCVIIHINLRDKLRCIDTTNSFKKIYYQYNIVRTVLFNYFWMTSSFHLEGVGPINIV